MKLPALLVGIVVGVLTVGFVSTPSNQTAQKKGNQKTQTRGVKNVYMCPMHPEVTSAKPGKCSECGMALVKKPSQSRVQLKKKYACPMHPEVTSDKLGECPKCGMNLKK
jgi:hypothetical protein